jgi:hypothetical protein
MPWNRIVITILTLVVLPISINIATSPPDVADVHLASLVGACRFGIVTIKLVISDVILFGDQVTNGKIAAIVANFG